jgi:hypothetical protein
MQAVRVGEARAGHAQPLGLQVHARHEAGFRAADILGHGGRNVVGRAHHQYLDRVVDSQKRAWPVAHLGGSLVGGAGRHLDGRIEIQFAVLHGTKDDIGCHQLGQRGGKPGMGGLFGRQYAPVFQVDDDGRPGKGHAGRHGQEDCRRRSASAQEIAQSHCQSPLAVRAARQCAM